MDDSVNDSVIAKSMLTDCSLSYTTLGTGSDWQFQLSFNSLTCDYSRFNSETTLQIIK